MATLHEKCVICREETHVTLKIPKSQGSDNHSNTISRLKLLTMESLCMLFGLPVNHSFITMFSGNKTEVNNVKNEESMLCNQCLQDTTDVHFIYWQLYNLELKLSKLQGLIFKRLNLSWGTSEEDEYSEGPHSKLVQSWFEDIKSGSDNWPKGIYISKWKEALKNVSGLINPAKIEIKTDPDYNNLSPEHEENYFDDYTDETINPISGTVNYPKKRKKQKSRVLHKYSMDSNGKYLCTEDPSICSRTYVTKQLLTGHIKDFHAGRIHICDQEGCVEKFKSEVTLIRHKRRIHGFLIEAPIKPKGSLVNKEEVVGKKLFTNRTFSCEEEDCKEKFKSKGRLSCHKKNAHQLIDVETSKVCDICGQTVSSKNMWIHYRTNHLGFGRFKCEFCSMDFSDPDQFKTHENLHNQLSQTLPFTCVAKGCSEVLTNSYDLKKHVKNNHLLSGLKCEICGIMKHNQFLLNRHLKIHRNALKGKESGQPIICEFCGKSYVSEVSLKTHKAAFHTGRKFPCEICGKVLKRSNHLTRHLRNHSEERPFKCDICGKGFGHQENLRKHEEIHSGTKKYECHLCGKRFRQGQNLKQHLKTQVHRAKNVENVKCEDKV